MHKNNWIFCLIISLLAFSCNSDDNGGLTVEETNAIKLSGTWKMGTGDNAKRDGVIITDEYQNLLVRFTTSNQYTIQGDPNNVFYPTGTWRFAENDISRVYLNTSTVPISLTYSATRLTLSFNIEDDQPIGGRGDGISGEFIFELRK